MGQAITGNPGTKWWSSRENPGMRLYGLGMMREPRGNSPILSRCGVISMSVRERVRRALARVIVRRSADTPEAEDEVSRSERALERRGDEIRHVAEILAPLEPHSTRAENRDHFGEMLVLALAANDFLANDDGADPHTRLTVPWIGSLRSSPRRERPKWMKASPPYTGMKSPSTGT